MRDEHDDDQFLRTVRRAVSRTDTVPREVVDFAIASLAFRDIESALGRIIDDSLVADAALAVRATATSTRQLTLQFDGGSSLSLYLDDTIVVGQLEPVAGGVVRLVQAHDELETRLDAFGEFVLHGCPRGPFRIELRLDTGKSLVTEWLLR